MSIYREVISVRGVSVHKKYGSKRSAFASKLSAFNALLSLIIGISVDDIGLLSIHPPRETDVVDEYVSCGYDMEFSISISMDCVVRSVVLETGLCFVCDVIEGDLIVELCEAGQ